ncbi:MAG: TonB-dependent receptor [Bacteroidota bacterium]
MKNTGKILMAGIILLLCIATMSAQSAVQTIRGKVIDQDSKTPLPGANIIVAGSSPVLGSCSDADGIFRIGNVPVGRVNLKISSLGYEEKFITNILVGSGKEIVLTINLAESVENLNEVTVEARRNKSETINKLALVSARTFSVEETGRYAGTLNDPARMVSCFAGVANDPAGNNDIVVRGNSPRGILWRLEGVEIPNPNHFANEGSTGGPVNSLNPSMLSNSDFFSGAFPPEYGNALSGVFDIYFRPGNNEKMENSFSAGIIGIDFTTEGPFIKGYEGSYLLNYRYSSIDLLDKAGLLDFGGIPKYQDAAFKLMLPTEKFGRFSIFGQGGESHISQKDIDEEENITYSDGDFAALIGVTGINHSYIFNENSYLRTSLSASVSQNGYNEDLRAKDGGMFNSINEKYREGKLRFAGTYNYKLSPKNNIQSGIILTRMSYSMLGEEDFTQTGTMHSLINESDYTGMAQAFTSWKFRLNKDITFVSGFHYTHFFLNGSYSLEPRAGLKWQFRPGQSFSLGYGIHSRPERISTYLVNVELPNGTSGNLNRDLEMTKAAHYVAGYDRMLNENLHLRAEVYYQQLYDIPVENDIHSGYSVSNVSEYFAYKELVNEGTGRNYGLELTLERFFANNFYYLLTTSLYDSKYTALDGVERNSRYNARYAGNVVAGKEFRVGKAGKNKTIGLNARITLIGGNMYTPIDMEASRDAGYTVPDHTRSWTMKGDDVFFMNIGITYRRERVNTTHELLFDIRNVTNNQAVIMEYYNARLDEIELAKQLPFIPNISYTIKF